MKIVKKLYEEWLFGNKKADGQEICRSVFKKYNTILEKNYKNCNKIEHSGTESELKKRICLRKFDILFCSKVLAELRIRSKECNGDSSCLQIIRSYSQRLEYEYKDIRQWLIKLQKSLESLQKEKFKK